jgi:hypothetical protein
MWRFSLLRTMSAAAALSMLACGAVLLADEPAPAVPGPGGEAAGLVSVRQFGAAGDAQADDTAAIQRAVDSGIGGVRFPRGVYRITQPVVIDLDRVGPTALVADGTARILMAGPGPAFRFVGTHEGTADPPTVKPNVWERQRMPVVDGLEIVGAHEEAVGIEAAGTMQLVVTRVNIREALHGIHLVKRNRNVIVADCHLYNNRGAGLFLDDVDLHQINVLGSHISYNAAGGIVSRAGNVRNLQVTGCDIEANMPLDPPAAQEAPPTANILIDCTGGRGGTAEMAITGCTIQHSQAARDSANIRYIGLGADDRRWGHLVIANNVMSDVQVDIDVESARGVSIVGNTFWSGKQHNLRIVDSTSVVVGPNVMDRNPEYRDEDQAADGVLVRGCRDSTITGLHLDGVRGKEAGLVIEDCRRVNVTGCTILDCDNAGLLLKNVTDSRVSDCLISNELSGATAWEPIKVVGGGGNTIVEDRPEKP